MAEMWIRGNFFQEALDYVKRKRGNDGLDSIGMYPEEFLDEQTYPFTAFCDLLLKISRTIGDGNIGDFSKLAADMVKNDERWKLLFKDQNPKDIFSTTKRQEDRYKVGDFEVKESEGNKITIDMSMWAGKKEHQDIWAEFYKGRLEGVLWCTGHEGSVEVKPRKKKGAYQYTITWKSL